MATAIQKFDFTGVANRIRWSNGSVTASGSYYRLNYITSTAVTITGTQPGHGRVDSISVVADGCPVSATGYNGTQYTAAVTVSCNTFSVSETFSGMAAHGTQTWPTVTTGTSEMLSSSFWSSLKVETNDSFSLWADQANSVTVTINYTENPPVLTAPTLRINGSTNESHAITGTLSWSGGNVSGDGTSPSDYMLVDIYTSGGTYVGYSYCQINATTSYTIPSPSTYTTTTGFYINCSYSGTSATSNTVFYKYVSATISAPSDQQVNGASSSTAQTCTLTWTASVCSDPSLEFNYRIYSGNTLMATNVTTTSYTFPKSVCSQWTGTMTFQVCGHLVADDINSYLSNSVTFTYRDSYTVAWYVNGAWQDCVVYYYDNGWKECIPYIYSNGWQECSTT